MIVTCQYCGKELVRQKAHRKVTCPHCGKEKKGQRRKIDLRFWMLVDPCRDGGFEPGTWIRFMDETLEMGGFAPGTILRCGPTPADGKTMMVVGQSGHMQKLEEVHYG